MVDYVLSARAVKAGAFVNDVGPSKFLAVPDGQTPAPAAPQLMSATAWYKAVRSAAEWTNAQGQPRGDVLVVVHGYNNSADEIMKRHRMIRDDLGTLGFKGVIVSFDWPCGDQALAYLDDRHHAKLAALQLVSDGIVYLSKAQGPGCTTNVHVLGHSTGAYVIREAFDDADDTHLENGAWTASQVVFAAGDVSAASMGQGDPTSKSVYRHCVRLTNYSNRHDQVLDISNVKRLGMAPRVGRVELPPDAPPSAVNVDCSAYYELFDSNDAIAKEDSPGGVVGARCHSWYFGNHVFAQDLFSTLVGTDRSVMPTRDQIGVNRFVLKRAQL
jgi:esterase/lipase superfamily enzyme